MHPIYKFLTEKDRNGYKDSSVKWNFQKYLIDEDGFLVKIVSPKVKPDDPVVLNWINS
jgi:glutathione peroxidase